MTIRAGNGLVVGGQGDPGRGQVAPRGARRTARARPELGEQVRIRARHAAVSDVADDGHPQAFQARTVIENRQGVEQRLRGVLVRAVPRIDDRDAEQPREKVGRPKGRAPNHNRVRTHGAKVLRSQ
jgi:hypothetical protein